MKYSLWTVIKKTKVKRKNRTYLWLCKCECGTERFLQIQNLIRGTSKGCGCNLTDDFHRFNKFKNHYEINENGCWIWKGSINKEGYGRINSILAHRYFFQKYKGLIPEGMCVCHNCPGGDNRACVNPDHLWLGTQAENILDKKPKGKQNFGENQASAKLTEKQVIEIKERLLKGEKTVYIAKIFKVSHGLIGHIKHGKAWKHLL